MTKYATAVFFVLVLSLSLLHGQQQRAKQGQLTRMLESSKEPAPIVPKPIVTPNTNLTTTNFSIPAAPTNAAAPTTNTSTPAPTEK